MEKGAPPGLEINYGSVDSPQTIWFELPQVSGHPGPMDPGAGRSSGPWAVLRTDGVGRGGRAGSIAPVMCSLLQAQELMYTIVFLLDGCTSMAQWPGLQ